MTVRITHYGPPPGWDVDYVTLEEDGVEVFRGDWYHDRIDEYIDGYLRALARHDIPHTVERRSLPTD